MADSAPDFTMRGGRNGHAYNEAAFRHFLNVDRRRPGTSSHPVLLVLVSVREVPGRNRKLSAGVASALFGALRGAVREVDVVGWYKEDAVAAAMLTQRITPSGETSRIVADRVRRVLAPRLPQNLASELRVRVVRFRAPSDN